MWQGALGKMGEERGERRREDETEFGGEGGERCGGGGEGEEKVGFGSEKGDEGLGGNVFRIAFLFGSKCVSERSWSAGAYF